MKIKIVATTDTGTERTNNEDSFIVCPDLSKQDWSKNETSSYIPLNFYGSILVVADGMGGANAGEIASSIATEAIRDYLSNENIGELIKENNGDILGILKSCIKNADDKINRRISEDPETSGMGTTIVVCWIINQVAYIAWCGDSRCYVYNPHNGMRQLTKDHSLVQELIDRGEIKEEEAISHPDSNVITQGLGDFDTTAIPDAMEYPLTPNDLLLLCSDGLCGYCTNKEIESVLQEHYVDIVKCRDELLKHALDAGGYDNISIVLASLISNEQCVPSTLSVMQKQVVRLKRWLRS